MPPCSAAAASTQRRTASSSVRSTGSEPSVGAMSQPTTVAPAPANSAAAAAPWPPAVPVIRATLPPPSQRHASSEKVSSTQSATNALMCGMWSRPTCSAAPSSTREDPQLALGAVDRLVVGLVGVVDRDLPVVLAVGDQERDGDLVDDAVEVDPLGVLDELVDVVAAPHPEHVLPVVRHRVLALALEALLLHLAPVVVGAPDGDELDPLLERRGARARSSRRATSRRGRSGRCRRRRGSRGSRRRPSPSPRSRSGT